MAKHKVKKLVIQKPPVAVLGTGLARRAAEAARKREAKRRKLLGM